MQRICESGSSLQISTSEKWEWEVSLLEKSVFQFGACVVCTVCRGMAGPPGPVMEQVTAASALCSPGQRAQGGFLRMQGHV